MRSSAPWWGLLSSGAAPVLLIGGWTLAAAWQGGDHDSTVETISSLAGSAAEHRWLMTTALLGVGVCHLTTAAALAACATPGRLALGLGGVATMLVAAFPLPATGGSPAHAGAAGAAFLALAVWPALGWRRGYRAAPALRPAPSVAATVVLLALLGWFAVSLSTGQRIGLAERVAAGAQAIWPLVAVLSVRAARHPATRNDVIGVEQPR